MPSSYDEKNIRVKRRVI